MQSTSISYNPSVLNVSAVNTTPSLENNQTIMESIPTELTYNITTSEDILITSETINATASYVILMTSENEHSLYSGKTTDDTNSSIQTTVEILTTSFQMSSYTDTTSTYHEKSSVTTVTTELMISSSKSTATETSTNTGENRRENVLGGDVEENIREFLRKQRDESDVDIRPSAIAIGVTSACVISFIALGIFLMDIGKFYKDIKGMKRNLIYRWKRETSKVETTHF